jgi:hypothetical protein
VIPIPGRHRRLLSHYRYSVDLRSSVISIQLIGETNCRLRHVRNFYKAELWTRDDRIERMLFAGDEPR